MVRSLADRTFQLSRGRDAERLRPALRAALRAEPVGRVPDERDAPGLQALPRPDHEPVRARAEERVGAEARRCRQQEARVLEERTGDET